MQSRFILASSSPFRKQLLEKVLPEFDCFSPDINESPKQNEDPIELVERLAQEKAAVAKQQFDQGIVIGSDQIALFNNTILGKPLTQDNAIAQLTQFSGQKVRFITSLALLNLETNQQTVTHDITDVYFRELSDLQIKHYIAKEMPLYCAGSFKAEGLGICLFEKLVASDPNSLIGLPLIKLNKILSSWDIELLS